MRRFAGLCAYVPGLLRGISGNRHKGAAQNNGAGNKHTKQHSKN
jgi:hypothetical protein